MKTISFRQWAKRVGACDEGVRYLRGKSATWATWIRAGGAWREWVCSKLGVRWLHELDAFTCNVCSCGDCENLRLHLNDPAVYAALRAHWETVVLPALRKEGVR